MKINSKAIFLLGFIGLAIYLYSHFVYKNSSEPSEGIILSALAKPKSNLPDCYPSETNGPPFEKYTVRKNRARYTYYGASRLSDRDQMHSLDIILIKQDIYGKCEFLNKENQYISLLAYVTEDVAVDLEKQRFKKKIDKVGLKAYQVYLDNDRASESPNLSFYFPEQVMALKEMGVRIPKNTIIVNQTCENDFLDPYNKRKIKIDKSYAAKLKANCPPFKKYDE